MISILLFCQKNRKSLIHKIGKIEFDYDSSNKTISNVHLGGDRLDSIVSNSLKFIWEGITASPRYEIVFDPNSRIYEICNDVFISVKDMQENNNDNLAILLSDEFFNHISNRWKELLDKGKTRESIGFLHAILKIVRDWEQKNQTTIYKAIPYLLLAENYLINGDRDIGLIYLFNSIDEDRKLYRDDFIVQSKARKFIVMSIDDNPLHGITFNCLNTIKVFDKFKQNYNQKFSIDSFYNKFLNRRDLEYIVYFFVYNLLYIKDLREHTTPDLIQNDFFLLKTIDLFFNMGLIIEETLKKASFSKVDDNMLQNVIRLCNNRKWIPQDKLEKHRISLKLNEDPPDVVIPKLLSMNNGLTKEVTAILLAYHLRNYTAHNLQNQTILTKKFDEILEQMFIALFLVINTL